MNTVVASIPKNKIAQFCKRWRVTELALFGSALRDDFNSNSDLDVLVTFAADVNWGLLDHVQMQEELQALLRWNVDLVSKRALEQSENWLRRKEILDTAQVFFSEEEAIHATR
jgi:predicted nucleotidyltransferase